MAITENLGGQPMGRPSVVATFQPLNRVMCVDDGVVDQMLFKRVLKRNLLAREITGHTLPDEALDDLSDPDAAAVDLILLDVNMPRMDGFEFLLAAEKVLGKNALPPVIVMLTTALSTAHRARAAGIDAIRGYLPKPLQVNGLKDMISDIRAAG